MLGPLEVSLNGEPIDIAGTKQRLLLAILACTPTPIPADRLVRTLWAGEDEPEDPSNALQRHVSRLRRTTGATIERTGGAYSLVIDAADVDAVAFTDLIEQGLGASRDGLRIDAASAFREALSLWRGLPLEEFLGDPWAVAESDRLQRLRATALEELFEAELADGRHADLLPELATALEDHPANERMWGQLMLALYRSGHQAEALDAFHRARRLLADEYGIDPSPELQALETAILAQDPALAATEERDRPSSGPPSTIPERLDGFVGRHDEVRQIKEAIGSKRLVTLTGAPGVGKTRLASEIAAEERRFPDGRWFVPLATVATIDDAPGAIGAALGVRGAGPPDPGDPLSGLLAHVGARRALLVLDNCEHLLPQIAAIAERLTRACPHLTVLATSREGLGVQGETTWPVAPLEIPAPGTATAGGIEASDAARLFVERARQIAPSFALTDETAPAVAEICRSLDGIPLALELAAARVSVLPVTHIAAALDDRFRLLSGSRAHAGAGQQTLREAIGWSYDLLDEDEQRVFAIASVFAGGLPLQASPHLERALGVDRFEIIEVLGSLVARSLLTTRTDPLGEPRYHMLGTLRLYARDETDAAAGLDDGWAILSAFASETAGVNEVLLYGAQHRLGMARLHIEIDNIRAAVRRATEIGDGVTLLSIAAAMAWYHAMTEGQTEGRRWLASALDVADRDDDRRAQALSYLCLLAEQQRDYPVAIEAGSQAIAIADPSDDDWAIGLAHTALAGALRDAGQLDEVAAHLATARASFERLDDGRADWGVAGSLMIAVRLGIDLDDAETIDRTVAEIEATATKIGYDPWVASASMFASHAALRRGDIETAVAHADRALQIATPLGYGTLLALASTARARLALWQGDTSLARTLASQATAAVDPITARWFAGSAMVVEAAVAQAEGDLVRADALYNVVLEHSPPPGSTDAHFLEANTFGGDPATRASVGLGLLALARDELVPAEQHLFTALDRAQIEHDDEGAAQAFGGLADVAMRTGAVERAGRLLAAASSFRADRRVIADPDAAARDADLERTARDTDAAAFERGRAVVEDLQVSALPALARP